MDVSRVTITKCPCGYKTCRSYHLVGIGKFAQGSGFTRAEAQLIADLINIELVIVRIRRPKDIQMTDLELLMAFYEDKIRQKESLS